MKAKRVIGVSVCALLCAALYAPAAFASELTAGSQGKAELQDQAATKTVYVLTKETEKFAGEGSSATTSIFSYNTSGLVNKFVYKLDKKKSVYKYAYDKSNRLTKATLPSGIKSVNKYSNGNLVQTTMTYSNSILTKEVYKATYKSGKITKKTRIQYFTGPDGNKWTDKTTFKYTYNKKGLISKYGLSGSMNAFKYDAHNNFAQISAGGIATKYENTYDSKGNLVKQVELYGDNAVSTTTYEYKKIKVKKALAEKIEQQQWSLLNGDLNNARSLQD